MVIPGFLTNPKVLAGIAIVVVIAGLGLYVKYQGAKIETLTTKLETSELNNKRLNATIAEQNAAIIASNKQFELVQTQLHEANGLNKAIVKEFKTLKQDINKRPIPQTCEAALQEMVSVGKAIGGKWKK